MTEEESRDVVIALAGQVRRLGWEDLIEVQITPEDAERGVVDPALARDLVRQLAKVVRDLDALELALTSIPEVTSIAFKPDIGEDTANLDDKIRFDRGHRLDREQRATRRQTLQALRSNLSDLEGQLAVG